MKLKTGTAFAIMVVLIIGSVLFGAYKGWTEEKSHVDATYAGLESMLQTRVETAYNILAVAKRHVPETDEAYQRVSMDLSQLDNQYNDLSRKAEANDALGASVLLRVERSISINVAGSSSNFFRNISTVGIPLMVLFSRI